MTDFCPECGTDLTNKDKAKHAYAHWGVRPEDSGMLPPAARARYNELVGKARGAKGGD